MIFSHTIPPSTSATMFPSTRSILLHKSSAPLFMFLFRVATVSDCSCPHSPYRGRPVVHLKFLVSSLGPVPPPARRSPPFRRGGSQTRPLSGGVGAAPPQTPISSFLTELIRGMRHHSRFWGKWGHRGRSPLYINWAAGGFRKKLCFSAPSTKGLPKQGRNALGRKGLREWGRLGEAKCLPKVYQGNFCRSNERLFCCFGGFFQPFSACHRCCTALSSCFWECIPPFARKWA